MIDMFFELISHEVVSKLAGVAKALKSTVHIASISKIFKPYYSLPSSIVFFLKIELFKGDGTFFHILLLCLTFSFMIFPIIF